MQKILNWDSAGLEQVPKPATVTESAGVCACLATLSQPPGNGNFVCLFGATWGDYVYNALSCRRQSHVISGLSTGIEISGGVFWCSINVENQKRGSSSSHVAPEWQRD